MILSSSQAAVYGAPNPHRQPLSNPLPRITRPLTAPNPVVVPVVEPQTPAWRERAVALAWETGWQCQATYSGHSARGVEVYAVPSSRHGHGVYRVTFTPDPHAITIHDGRYICSCIAASHDRPCRHAGAALLLAQGRAEVRDSIEAAKAERLSWSHATHNGYSDQGRLAWFIVGESAARQWRHIKVAWDTARDVAIWCDCGRTVCPHIGAVALRVRKEQADALWRAQHNPDPDWTNALEPLWDGAVLPAALV